MPTYIPTNTNNLSAHLRLWCGLSVTTEDDEDPSRVWLVEAEGFVPRHDIKFDWKYCGDIQRVTALSKWMDEHHVFDNSQDQATFFANPEQYGRHWDLFQLYQNTLIELNKTSSRTSRNSLEIRLSVLRALTDVTITAQAILERELRKE